MNKLLVSTLLFVTTANIAIAQTKELRVWQHIDGRKASASLVKLPDDDHCVLRSESGGFYKIPLSLLCDHDRIYLRRFINSHVQLASTAAPGQVEGQEFDLGSEPDVQAAFEELAEKTGREEVTKTKTETRSRMVSKTVMECRCVCESGRWVWRWVPMQVEEEQAYTVQVPYTVVNASRLIDGPNWSKADPATGIASLPVDLRMLPSSAGGRAQRIIQACNQIVSVTGVASSIDTIAAMGSELWSPVTNSPNIERAYQIKATVNPANFQTIRLEVLVRERNKATLIRATDKPRLDGEANTIAKAVKNKLTTP